MGEMKRINRELQTATENLVYEDRYKGREDFAVVLQPFFRNSIVPLDADGVPDTTYFSQDCFHFSERGHADMAAALWNNMLEPVGKKQTYNNFTNARNILKCPTEVRHLLQIATVDPFLQCILLYVQHNYTWLAAVLAVVGLLVGCAVTGLLLSYRHKRSKKKTSATVEMNASAHNAYSNSYTETSKQKNEESRGQNSAF
uniref:Phospholipase B1, membrane-associated-like n=1 Tax=Poecilia mexicana TaxID=48701 RepID=A0A3B3WJ40_9TELE